MEIILEIFPPLLSCIRSCCWAAWGGGGRSAANVSIEEQEKHRASFRTSDMLNASFVQPGIYTSPGFKRSSSTDGDSNALLEQRLSLQTR